jgi:rod shape-determining protein MreD
LRARDASSEGADVFRASIGFVLLVLAYFAVRPLFSGRANVDFLTIAILFTAVRVRPGVAAVIGLLGGLTIDALEPTTFGAAMLVMTAISFVGSRTKTVFFADYIALTGLFVFLGKWLFDIGYVLLGRGVHGVDLAVQLLVWSPISAALTAIVALLLLTLVRPLYRAQAT